MILDRQLYDLIRRRAAKPVYDRFGVNRFELGLLDQLCAILRIENRYYCSRNHLFDTITSNSREKYKMGGYLAGLLEKRLVGSFEYIKKPGSFSLGISDLGAAAIRHYESEIAKLIERYKTEVTAIPMQSDANNSMYRPNIAA